MSGLLIAFGFAILITFAFMFLIAQTTHKNMTVDNTQIWDYGTFESFKREFEKRKWNHEGWDNSFFDRLTNSQIHAGIVSFDNKGMVLLGLHYVKVYFYLRPLCKKKTKKQKGLWKGKLRVVK